MTVVSSAITLLSMLLLSHESVTARRPESVCRERDGSVVVSFPKQFQDLIHSSEIVSGSGLRMWSTIMGLIDVNTRMKRQLVCSFPLRVTSIADSLNIGFALIHKEVCTVLDFCFRPSLR